MLWILKHAIEQSSSIRAQDDTLQDFSDIFLVKEADSLKLRKALNTGTQVAFESLDNSILSDHMKEILQTAIKDEMVRYSTFSLLKIA
jgi:hypothetical protein